MNGGQVVAMGTPEILGKTEQYNALFIWRKIAVPKKRQSREG